MSVIKYLTHDENYWICDIEADGLNPTQIWCVVVRNLCSSELITWDLHDLDSFVAWYNRTKPTFVGHNFVSYDGPSLNRLLGLHIPLDGIVDTLVLSYLYDPRMPGGHSLEAWGERLRTPKVEHSDWTQYSPEMLNRCIGDVNLNYTLYLRLTKRMRERGFSEFSCEIEHKVRIVLDKQERNGWYFDIEGAISLRDRILTEQAMLGESIHELFPPALSPVGNYVYRTTASGEPHATYKKHLLKYPRLEHNRDGTYTVFDWQEFNIGSPKQRLEKLISLGFKPQKLTKNGNPSVDEDSLVDFAEKSGIPEVQAIADWLVLQGRASMILTWLNNVDRTDSRMRGRVFTCGAGTRRMTHAAPNTANIPKAKKKVKYGIECRQLWTVPNAERVLVGYDAAGLEMRMFGHYLNNPDAAKLYIEGDPHQANADLIGIERDPVKNVFYAFLYGAQDAKLGWTADTRLVSKRKQSAYGKEVRSKLVDNTPGLKELVDHVQRELAESGGWIQTIDGGYVRCGSPHAALNYLLQSAGAIVMKLTSIIIDEEITRLDLDAKKVADVHDEGQMECDPRQAHQIGEICVEAIREAGRRLGFRVPLDGAYSVGTSWAETH